MAANKVVLRGGDTLIDLTGDTVTPEQLAKGITAHDASGAQITGSLEVGGAQSETWVLNEALDSTAFSAVSIDFVSNDKSFSSIRREERKGRITTYYDNTVAYADMLAPVTPAYRKLTFTTPPTGDFLAWLQENAVKQASDTAIEPEKSVTITSNGTAEITPDVPYDAMAKVNVTVNVAGDAGATASVYVYSVDGQRVSYTCINPDGVAVTVNVVDQDAETLVSNVGSVIFGTTENQPMRIDTSQSTGVEALPTSYDGDSASVDAYGYSIAAKITSTKAALAIEIQ